MKNSSNSSSSLIDWRRFAGNLRLAVHVGAILMVLFCAWICWEILTTMENGRSRFGTPDYAGFYVAATILNESSPGKLYDRQLQEDIYHRRFSAAPASEAYPFAHIPVVAYLLRPLARLPFALSYGIWLIVLAVFIVVALAVTRCFMSWPPKYVLTASLLASAFPPLIMECWPAGQLAAVGLLWIALTLWLVRDGRLFAAGIVLSMCLYKPTLLMFALPILLLSGRWRLIAGVACGGLVLGGICLWIVGIDGTQGYYEMLTGYTETMASGAETEGFKVFKHVDLNSFFTLLFGGSGFAARAGYVTICAIFVPLLLAVWWSRAGASSSGLILALCATLTANAVFSAYTPIYDVSLLIPNVVITGDIVYRRSRWAVNRGQSRWLGAIVLLLIAMSWVTQGIAKELGFQPLTLTLLGLCGFQVWLAFDSVSLSNEAGKPFPAASDPSHGEVM